MRKCCAVLTVLFCCITVNCQTKGEARPNACDSGLTFCWYGPYSDGSDEVEATGDRWMPQEASEKSIEWPSHVRCLKKYGICVDASSPTVLGKITTTVEILSITGWDSQQVTAERNDDPCERNTLILSKLDRSVLLVSSPGRRGDSEACGTTLGKPKTVIYRLSQK